MINGVSSIDIIKLLKRSFRIFGVFWPQIKFEVEVHEEGGVEGGLNSNLIAKLRYSDSGVDNLSYLKQRR
jgi:hypothetical protein